MIKDKDNKEYEVIEFNITLMEKLRHLYICNGNQSRKRRRPTFSPAATKEKEVEEEEDEEKSDKQTHFTL